MLVLQHDMDDLLRDFCLMAKAEELRNLGIVEEADLEEVDEDFLRDPECTINLVTKRRLRKMKAAWDARKIGLSAVAALGFAPAAPGFSADGAAGGKRAKDTEPEAAGEATKQPCVSAPGADGEPAFGGASAVVAAAARVEQPGREEEQMQSQDSRGPEGADDASHALLQGKASPAPRSPSTPKSSLPTPTWGESAPQSCPSLTVGSAQLGGEAAVGRTRRPAVALAALEDLSPRRTALARRACLGW